MHHETEVYIDELETLFVQLKFMGDKTRIAESYRAPLVLASMINYSRLESTVTILRTKHTDKFSWEEVTSDQIQEWSLLMYKQRSSM